MHAHQHSFSSIPTKQESTRNSASCVLGSQIYGGSDPPRSLLQSRRLKRRTVVQKRVFLDAWCMNRSPDFCALWEKNGLPRERVLVRWPPEIGVPACNMIPAPLIQCTVFGIQQSYRDLLCRKRSKYLWLIYKSHSHSGCHMYENVADGVV
jgi:hypothetical protein